MAKKQSKISKAPAHMTGGGDAGRRIVPLDGGRHLYLRTKEHKTLHLRTDSDALVEQVRAEVEADAAGGRHIERELGELHEQFPDSGWDATLTRLRDAGALTAG